MPGGPFQVSIFWFREMIALVNEGPEHYRMFWGALCVAREQQEEEQEEQQEKQEEEEEQASRTRLGHTQCAFSEQPRIIAEADSPGYSLRCDYWRGGRGALQPLGFRAAAAA